MSSKRLPPAVCSKVTLLTPVDVALSDRPHRRLVRHLPRVEIRPVDRACARRPDPLPRIRPPEGGVLAATERLRGQRPDSGLLQAARRPCGAGPRDLPLHHGQRLLDQLAGTRAGSARSSRGSPPGSPPNDTVAGSDRLPDLDRGGATNWAMNAVLSAIVTPGETRSARHRSTRQRQRPCPGGGPGLHRSTTAGTRRSNRRSCSARPAGRPCSPARPGRAASRP